MGLEECLVYGIEATLFPRVKRQLVSDVPLGVYLSGGIDSSSLVANASQEMGSQLQPCVDEMVIVIS